MNEHARVRLTFATALAAELGSWPGLEAVGIGGSAARGWADQYSDIELLLFWQEPLDAATRAALLARWQATPRYPAFDPGHSSAFWIRGVPVDLWLLTVAEMQGMIDAVLRDNSTDLVTNSMVGTVAACVPLDGRELLGRWQTALAAYPPEVALRLIEQHVNHFSLRQLELAARRDNPTRFLHILTDIQCSLFIVLLALNRRYFPTFKWIYETLEELPIAPAQLPERLRAMFAAPPIAATAALRAVLAETLDLVEQAFPQLDTAYARYGLDQVPGAYPLSKFM